MGEWIIVGDTEKYTECLVRPCGTKADAEKELQRMLTAPDSHDKHLMEGMFNFKVVEVPLESCWWNDPFLAN